MTQALSLSDVIAHRYQPVSVADHPMHSWTGFADYQFAQGYRTVPLIVNEVVLAAAAMPVLFQSVGTQDARLVALLDTGPAQVITPDGRWGAAYVPGALRAHPFHARPDGSVLFDPQSPHTARAPKGSRFFDTLGKPTPAFKAVMQFCKTYGPAQAHTQAAATALRHAGVLIPAGTAQGLDPEVAAGLWVADLARIKALPPNLLHKLGQSDALTLAYAHLVSLPKIAQLKSIQGMRHGPATQAAPSKETGGVDSFLAALANAQS